MKSEFEQFLNTHYLFQKNLHFPPQPNRSVDFLVPLDRTRIEVEPEESDISSWDLVFFSRFSRPESINFLRLFDVFISVAYRRKSRSISGGLSLLILFPLQRHLLVNLSFCIQIYFTPKIFQVICKFFLILSNVARA